MVWGRDEHRAHVLALREGAGLLLKVQVRHVVLHVNLILL